MGVGWTKKFPSAFAALKEGDYSKAADQLLYNTNKNTGEKTKTGYYKDTGVRAEKIALLLKYGAGDVEEFHEESKDDDLKIAKN